MRNPARDATYMFTMKTIAACALALLLPCVASASGKKNIEISFSSEDTHAQMGPRHLARDARLAITTRDGSTSLLITNDVVAVQLTDATLSHIEPKTDANFLEELLVSGVRMMMNKAVDYPIEHIRSADVRDGTLILINDENKPVFTEIKVNGTDVLRGFSSADAAKFANTFRMIKLRH